LDFDIVVKWLLTSFSLFFVALTAALADLRPVDSSAPILQYFTPIEIAPRPGHSDAPNFTFDERKPLLTITSLRQLVVHRDGKGVTIVLNDKDKQRYAELTHRFQGRLLICAGQGNIVSLGKITSPTENGMIEFSDARFTGDIAKYLRRRFGR
jgi:hypothetical protein